MLLYCVSVCLSVCLCVLVSFDSSIPESSVYKKRFTKGNDHLVMLFINVDIQLLELDGHNSKPNVKSNGQLFSLTSCR